MTVKVARDADGVVHETAARHLQRHALSKHDCRGSVAQVRRLVSDVGSPNDGTVFLTPASCLQMVILPASRSTSDQLDWHDRRLGFVLDNRRRGCIRLYGNWCLVRKWGRVVALRP
jgi:hypothetical protein